MKEKIYVETTVISYLAGRLSKDDITRGKQAATRKWWEFRDSYDLYISDAVLLEIQNGDRERAEERKAIASGLPVLAETEETTRITDALLERNVVPVRMDAKHIALAAHYKMDCLVTWNQSHIHNNNRLFAIIAVLFEMDIKLPIIVNPFFLLENDYGL